MGEGFPLWSMASMAAEGQEPLRDWISLYFLLFQRSQILAFHRFLNSRRSVTPIGLNFNMISIRILAFLRRNKGINHLTGWPRGPRARLPTWGAPPASWPSRASYRIDSSSQNSHIFQKKSPSVFIPFGLRLIWIFCETKNMQQTGTGTGHWINMLAPKIV